MASRWVFGGFVGGCALIWNQFQRNARFGDRFGIGKMGVNGNVGYFVK